MSLIGRVENVLDHGFIRVVDVMGNDTAIVNAARVSYGGQPKPESQNRGLINYLLRNDHTSPFEQAEIKFHVKMPMFVARQWLRHRTANVNEVSARYTILPDEFYIPEESTIAKQSDSNKQGRGDVIEYDDAKVIQAHISAACKMAYGNYKSLLNQGLAREVARIILPVNIYTEFYWKIDAHNLLHFIRLRADKHAQYEIRMYAKKLLEIVKDWLPLTFEAFQKYKVGAHLLSSNAKDVLTNGVCKNVEYDQESGLSKREWDEMIVPLLSNMQ